MNYLQLPEPVIFNAFRELLCSSLWDRMPENSFFKGLSDEQWHYIMTLSIEQAVNGIVFSSVEKLPEEYRPSKMLYIKWFAQVQQIILYNQHLRQAWGELLDVFNLNGVNVLLMKGLGIAHLYPNPFLRRQGDLDIYVVNDYDKAMQVMQLKGKFDHSDEEHDVFIYKGVTVELHHGSVYGLDGAGAIKQKDDYGEYSVPSVEHNASLLLQHAAKHYFNIGIGIRHLCDWAVFMHSYFDKCDIDSIKAEARRSGYYRFCVVFSSLAVSYLQMDYKYAKVWGVKTVETRDTKFLLHQLFNIGDFGKSLKRNVGHVYKNGRSMYQTLCDISFYYYIGMVRLFGGYMWYPSYARRKMFRSIASCFDYIRYKFSKK